MVRLWQRLFQFPAKTDEHKHIHTTAFSESESHQRHALNLGYLGTLRYSTENAGPHHATYSTHLYT